MHRAGSKVFTPPARYGIQTVFEWNEETEDVEVVYKKIPFMFDKYEFTDKEMKEMRAQKNPALQKFLDEELPKRDPNAVDELPVFTAEDMRRMMRENPKAFRKNIVSALAPAENPKEPELQKSYRVWIVLLVALLLVPFFIVKQ
ncbi:unnamed protein product [Caenorhabditis nigoni]